jgi:hypothetical protein
VTDLQQGARNANFQNGSVSNVTLGALYANSNPPGLAGLLANPNLTVAQDLAAHPNVLVESQLGGNLILLNPSTIVQFSATYLLGTIAHEILHNITGLTDPDLQRKLNLSDAQSSSNISLKLLVDCFLQGGFGPP